MTKISFLGAGSTVFTKTLLGDLLARPELAEADVRLHDIDEHRLGLSERVARRVASAVDARPTISATRDRERARPDHPATSGAVRRPCRS